MVMTFNPDWRGKAIDTLLGNDYDTVMNDSDYLYSLLQFGFKGYDNMTDEELEQELVDRDISTVFGDNDDENITIELDDISHINE